MAVTQIYFEKHGYLLAIARRNAACEADAEEALQEAFAAFVEHYDPARGAPPLAWLTLTMKRACWGAGRRTRVEVVGAGGDEDRGLAQTLGAPEVEIGERLGEREEAHRQLAVLRPDERSALGLQAAGYSYREIGERRGWTYTKVNRCIAEGRAALGRGGRAE